MRSKRPSFARALKRASRPALWLACSLTACAPKSAPPAPIDPEYSDVEEGTRPEGAPPDVMPLTPVASMQHRLQQACDELSPDRLYMTAGSYGWYASGLSAVWGVVDVFNPDALPCFNSGTGVITSDGTVIGRDAGSKTGLRTFVADIPVWSLAMKRWNPPANPADNDIYTEVGCEIFSIFPFPDRPGVLVQCTDKRWIDSDTLAELTLPLDIGLVAVGPAGLTLWTSESGSLLTLGRDDKIVAQSIKPFPVLQPRDRALFRIARATKDGFLVAVETEIETGLFSVSSTGDVSMVGDYARDQRWIPNNTGSAFLGQIALDPEGNLYMRAGSAQNKVWKYTPDGQPSKDIWTSSYATHGEKDAVFPVNRSGFMITGASGAH